MLEKDVSQNQKQSEKSELNETENQFLIVLELLKI